MKIITRVSLDHAPEIAHEGNVHATDKQQNTEVARLRDVRRIADERNKAEREMKEAP